jgi:signal transduction histidine kinase/CheY-like chemotaxis protein/PAS domain-containing protein
MISLSESERNLRFLDELAKAKHALSDPAAILQTTARMLGEHLGVNRCAYAQVEADQDHFALIGDYANGVESIVGRYAFSDFGDVVLDLMRADQPYVNANVDVDPRTAGTDLTAYRQTQIQAVICLPLHKEGRFVAAMAVHQATERQWKPYEIELVEAVVARCWETLNRARSEQALREANERLGLALASGGLGDWTWSALTDLVTLSDRAAEIFDLPHGAVVTWDDLRERLHPDDREPARLAVLQALEGRSDYEIEYRVSSAESERWISVHGRGLYGAGDPIGMIGVVQDVTSRRSIQERERAEASVLELLNQTAAALAAELDMDVLIQRVTDAATSLTGARFGAFFRNGVDEQGDALLLYTLSGASKAAFEGFGHPRPTALFGPTFRGEPTIRSPDILADPRYGHYGPHHGMPPGHLPVRSYLAVPVVSRSGEVIGGLFFGHPEPNRFTARSERLAEGVASQAAIAIDNARLYAEAQKAAEERKVLLERERKARGEAERASTSKDEFLATLSHELRTPLSAILGWAQILRFRLGPESEDLRKGVEVIERNARAQTQLIDDLLDMNRITAGKLRLEVQTVAPIMFIEQAIESIRPAADAARIRIETMLDPLAGPISGDPGRLQQIVWNLLTNAVKFTPAGGKIQVVLERVNSHIELSVADTGVGIAPELLPFVFDRFQQADSSATRRYGGLGLGLAIVRQLVELHGGRVYAKSAGQGAGACFVIHLPVNIVRPSLQSDRVHPEERSALASMLSGSELEGIRVLVVDDEADSRETLAALLTQVGATVLLADGAGSALSLMQRERPDVLVSDIGMPEIDGYELLRRIRAMGADAGGDLPAIALTAFARSEDRVRALRAGFSIHVAKPVDGSEIVASIASVAGR